MRNDARPIGEALRQGHDADRREQDAPQQTRGVARDTIAGVGKERFVTDDDPGDEETALPNDDPTLRTKI